MNAGKDVYSEKPMCRLREEAPVMVKTARATGRILQIGLQQRSGEIYIEPLERFVKSGAIGKFSPHRRCLARRRAGTASQGRRTEASGSWLAAFPGPGGLSRVESGDVLQLPLLSGILAVAR